MKLKISIAILLFGQIVFAQNRVQKIDSVLTAHYNNGIFNGNVLIAEHGKVIYKRSFGLANERTKEKLNDNSIFELASVSKQFTAMAIMILKEKGKLKLEDDFTKYIPELSHYKGITIKNLLNHTSGLPDYMDLMDSLFDKSKIATNKDIIALFAAHTPAVLFAPNTKWEYCNTGYAFLASIIQRVSGISYKDFLQKTIFTPLEMKRSFVYTRRYSPEKIKNYAFGYIYSDSLKKFILPDDFEDTKVVVWLDGVVGDGTVNSTVNDLLKWDRALYTNKLLTTSDRRSLFEVAKLSDGSYTKYGLGWFVDSTADYGRIVGHSGGWPGYKTYIDRHIGNDKTIIVLENHDHGSVSKEISLLRKIIYNKPLPVEKIREEIYLNRDQLQKFVGIYEIKEGGGFNISLDKDQLFAQLTGQDAFPIFAESDTSFFLKVVDARIQFIKNGNEEITGLILFQNGNKLEAKKIK